MQVSPATARQQATQLLALVCEGYASKLSLHAVSAEQAPSVNCPCKTTTGSAQGPTPSPASKVPPSSPMTSHRLRWAWKSATNSACGQHSTSTAGSESQTAQHGAPLAAAQVTGTDLHWPQQDSVMMGI